MPRRLKPDPYTRTCTHMNAKSGVPVCTHHLPFLHIHGEHWGGHTHSHIHKPCATANSQAHTSAIHTHTCTRAHVEWWERSQCLLINTGGRLKPLTQCAAMSFLWFTTHAGTIHNWPQRAIIELSNCLCTHTHIHKHIHSSLHEFSQKTTNVYKVLTTARHHLQTKYTLFNRHELWWTYTQSPQMQFSHTDG